MPSMPHEYPVDLDLTLAPELPVSGCREEILAAMAASQVVIISGEPGSGKTTQIPKLCLLAGRGRRGKIGCTQPRRIAAMAMASRLGEELGTRGGRLVGYRVRFSDHTSRETRVKFMTDGILLAEAQGDRELRDYDTIIVDEAHERSLNIDFLLGILKDLLARRPELQVIITSATIDTGKFSRHFNDAPVIEVSGRTHPVEVRYRPWREGEGEGESYVEQAVAAVSEIVREGRAGDILLFLPTERDIRETQEALAGALGRSGQGGKSAGGGEVIMPLYGRLSPAEQTRIFRPVKGRKIVLATNVAETSITVPGIRYVVDTGLARIASYNPRARTHKLPVVPISRSSCDQRAGRCGRVGPGICIRLFSQEDYDNRPLYTAPEIVRSNLAEVILRMVALKLGEPADFPFVDPPSSRAIKDGYQLLAELGAIEEVAGQGAGRPPVRLSRRGRLMARLPLDPCISRMIIEARENNALREVCVIAAALSIQDPRLRPPEKEKAADEAHRPFIDPRSDFLAYLKIWETARAVAVQTGSAGKMRKFCAGHFLSWQRLREWQDIHEQILRILADERGFSPNEVPATPAAVHRSLLSGNLRNIALKKEKNLYQGGGGRQLMIFPGSGLFNRGPQWLMAAELVETSRLYARTVAAIEPEWIEPLARPLMRYSYSDPHWEKRRGQVVATERGTLFGLPVVAGRKIPLARIDLPEARRLFIQAALVEGELRGEYPFLSHNRELLARLRDLEERSRRRDLLVDEQVIFDFYESRLGPEVYDQASLNRLLKKQRGDQFLRLAEEELIRREPDDDLPEKFPSTLQLGEMTLDLSYCFEPGAEQDGLTVTVPVHLAPHLPPEAFEWLVPGMLEEKIFFLLKNLPKTLRRPLVPIPQTAAELTRALLRRRRESGAGRTPEALCAALGREIYERYGLRIAGTAWPQEQLPPHLRCRFRLVDEEERELAAHRELAVLVRREPGAAAPLPAADLEAIRRRYEREVPNPAALPELPSRLPLTGADGTLRAYLFPGLVEEGGRIWLRLFSQEAPCRAATVSALLSLYRQEFSRQFKMVRKDCRLPRDQWLLYQGLGGVDGLEDRFFAFILGEIFAQGQGGLPTAADFAAKVARVREQGFYAESRRLFEQLLELLGHRREVLDYLARLPAELGEELRRRLEELMPADFLTRYRAEDLPRLQRYLRALRVRAERAYAMPAKDHAKAALLAPFSQRLSRYPEGGEYSATKGALLKEYRLMLEEYAISLFAQELGTLFPVSPKRLEEKWREIEQA
ncbi:ATP-dependent RNA helicase HrpA [Desulfurivibrio sp. D14AmB]|uniref:ATP-dependent RNA helicase HrpA n=1 Tax=Desulfurivibrio sp. D14AmB TaxID=3374370 RepID=UPI00376EAD9B